MHIMKNLQNKTAIITGSTSGIGLSIATELASCGANIVINGFGTEEEIQKIKSNFEEKFGVRVLYCAADVSSSKDVKEMVKEVISRFNSLDILVNNAGIQFVSPIVDFPEEKWDDIININLSASFKTTKASLPHMVSNGWGRIINIASAHGLVASQFKSAYVAAKHGLVGLTKVTALEMAEKNITCNAVCPGYVKTPLVEKQIAEQARANHIAEDQVIRDILLKAQPNKKFIQAEHIAKLVAFLCSEAGSGMTGEIISIDGGWTAH